MPVDPPAIDLRSYDDLVADALARIPVHNPEWTNFNESDPGVTLLELFAFLTESITYRANLIPERNRVRYLQLLGIARQTAKAARGMVSFGMPRGGDRATLGAGLEVTAGKVAFALDLGVEVLPVESLAVIKRGVPDPSPDVLGYHRRLYASYGRDGHELDGMSLYETVAVGDGGRPAVLADTVDGCVWLALLVPAGARTLTPADIRGNLANRTLSIGVVAWPSGDPAGHVPAGQAIATTGPGGALVASLPRTGEVTSAAGRPALAWATVPSVGGGGILGDPGVLELTLPDAAGLSAVTRADPLEEGVGDLPPAINDPAIAARVVTWIRLQAHAASDARILWAGVNAATVTQRRHVRAEALTAGTGEPDQRRTLAFAPVLDGSVALTVAGTPFAEIADLVDAGPEVLVPDPRAQPGAEPPAPAPADAFALDPATGTVTFGDGRRGRRPAAGAGIRADYDATMGAAGNLAAGQVTAGPDLPAGMTVTNPVPTWGGADPEPIDEAERHVARYVQHRDRLVTAEDVDAIARRTPGVRVGRVDVLPGYDPSLGAMPPGDAAGCITVMVVPASDPAFPLTPQPDQAFLDAVCAYLSPRRLATTELFVRGPVYVGLWVTIGYDPEPGRSLADLERALRARLERYLAAIDPGAPPWPALPPSGTPRPRIGWPLGTPVDRLALVAEADRVEGVNYVSDLRLAGGDSGEAERVLLAGLQLPRLLGVLAAPGAAPDIDGVRGLSGGGGAPTMPVPIVPGEC